jgi:hypothetical protein
MVNMEIDTKYKIPLEKLNAINLVLAKAIKEAEESNKRHDEEIERIINTKNQILDDLKDFFK